MLNWVFTELKNPCATKDRRSRERVFLFDLLKTVTGLKWGAYPPIAVVIGLWLYVPTGQRGHRWKFQGGRPPVPARNNFLNIHLLNQRQDCPASGQQSGFPTFPWLNQSQPHAPTSPYTGSRPCSTVTAHRHQGGSASERVVASQRPPANLGAPWWEPGDIPQPGVTEKIPGL